MHHLNTFRYWTDSRRRQEHLRRAEVVQRDRLLPLGLHLRLHQGLRRVQLLQIHHRVQKSSQIGRIQVSIFDRKFCSNRCVLAA